MSDQIGLSAADRQLLRQVFAWSRANGWRRIRIDYDGNVTPGFRDWHWFGPDREVFLEVTTFKWSKSSWRFVVTCPDCGIEMGADGGLPVTKAVDVLCALGVLPAEQSPIFAAGRESLLHEPNDIEATGECCCNGCIGFARCDLYDPCDADERAENDAERIAEMSDDERERCGE